MRSFAPPASFPLSDNNNPPQQKQQQQQQQQQESAAVETKNDENPFRFPYGKPYEIQRAFMENLVETLDNYKVGIFESPTGTGKSLSIICGSLTWLNRKLKLNKADGSDGGDDKPSTTTDPNNNDARNDDVGGGGGGCDPSKASSSSSASSLSSSSSSTWVIEFTKKRKREQEKRIALERERQEARKRRIALYEKKKKKKQQQQQRLRQRESDADSLLVSLHQRAIRSAAGEEKELLLNDYESGDDTSVADDLDRDQFRLNTQQRHTASKTKNNRKMKRQRMRQDICSTLQLNNDLFNDLFSSSEDEDDDDDNNADNNADDDDDDDDDTYITPKIFYCSRTHSQLTQFVNELKKTVFAASTDDGGDNAIRVVSMGSRKNMCIHPRVSKYKSLNRINEVCLDMQKSTTPKDKKCPYLEMESQNLYRDHVLLQVRDIEELVTLGQRIGSCPYYGTRKALPAAHVVSLPYSSLLHRETRESLGIDLKDSIVIIDEAHNLIDAINAVHSTQITAGQVSQAHAQLASYFAKYQNRLHPKNQSRIKQLLALMRQILAFLKFNNNNNNNSNSNSNSSHNNNSASNNVSATTATTTTTTTGANEEKSIMSINDFVYALNIDHINLFKVEEFIKKSELVKKLNGFNDKQREAEGEVAINKRNSNNNNNNTEEDNIISSSSSVISPIQQIASFLLALTNLDRDGRVLVCHDTAMRSRSSIKFVLLNPSVYFKEVVDEAKTVILAGGTMEPISEFVQQLFGHVESQKIKTFQCGHVIPDENLLPIALSHGPSGLEFEFNYQSRSNTAMLDELGRLMVNLCNVIPDGIVCFLPSYAFEEIAYNRWYETGIITQIQRKKKFFREPREASEVEEVLKEYKHIIDNNYPKPGPYFQGALLSCVVGGKMSEGINFSDGYGRCVVVVGMPYANPSDPELKEKMSYLNKLSTTTTATTATTSTTTTTTITAVPAGQAYYENLCMKAVNQSIGRSIRHANDYASIVLIDKRYHRPGVQAKLPKWIQKGNGGIQSHVQFGSALGALSKFFRAKRDQQRKFEEERRRNNNNNNNSNNNSNTTNQQQQ